MAESLFKSPLKQPSLVSSSHGSINHILFSYPDYKEDETVFKRVFGDLLRKLPQHTKFSIWVFNKDRIKNDLKKILTDAGISYKITPEKYNGPIYPEDVRCLILGNNSPRDFTVWAQDPFLAVQDKSANKQTESVLVEPPTFLRSVDEENFSNELSIMKGISTHNAPVYFHGGNVLSGDDFILIGKSDIRFSMGKLEASLSEKEKEKLALDLYKHYLDSKKRIIPVTSVQEISEEPATPNTKSLNFKQVLKLKGLDLPQPHIDLFISVAGKDKKGKNILLVGNPVSLTEEDGRVRSLQKKHNKLVKNLEKEGFNVIRNNTPLINLGGSGLFDYVAYYNNCLVQIDKSGKKVWIPSYGNGTDPLLKPHLEKLKGYDEENKKVWEGLGFDATLLTDYNEISKYRGAVHCITKTLSRGN